MGIRPADGHSKESFGSQPIRPSIYLDSAEHLAEGNGKYTSADRCRFFDNARGSALECAACLDVLVAKSLVEQAVAMEGKGMLIEIVSMLVGLIRSNSPSRDA